MQVFVMCPFCMKVFDSLTEPHFTFRLDGRVRMAHLSCFETVNTRMTAQSVQTHVQTKPNGEQKDEQP